MKFLVFSFLLLTFLSARAQIETTINRDSRSEKIEKARKLLLDAVVEMDKTATSELTNYLLGLEDENYLALLPPERWLLHYWLGDYRDVLRGVSQYDSSLQYTVRTRVLPAEDYLLAKLRERIDDQRSVILAEVSGADLISAEKDFLTLNLDFLLAGLKGTETTQDALNQASNDYLTKYPESIYEGFIRRYIRYELKPSKWGYAFEFFSGYGVFTDQLASHFKNSIPMGVAFDVCYKRWVLFLRDYIGFSRTVHPLSFQGGTWQENAQVRVFIPEATVGYVVRDLDRIKVTPFAGIASTSVSPTEYDMNKYPEYENVGLDFTATLSYGINLDIKLGRPKTPIVAEAENGYWFIRLRYAYNQPRFDKKYPSYRGDVHYVTLGIGGFGRRLKRER